MTQGEVGPLVQFSDFAPKPRWRVERVSVCNPVKMRLDDRQCRPPATNAGELINLIRPVIDDELGAPFVEPIRGSGTHEPIEFHLRDLGLEFFDLQINLFALECLVVDMFAAGRSGTANATKQIFVFAQFVGVAQSDLALVSRVAVHLPRVVGDYKPTLDLDVWLGHEHLLFCPPAL